MLVSPALRLLAEPTQQVPATAAWSLRCRSLKPELVLTPPLVAPAWQFRWKVSLPRGLVLVQFPPLLPALDPWRKAYQENPMSKMPPGSCERGWPETCLLLLDLQSDSPWQVQEEPLPQLVPLGCSMDVRIHLRVQLLLHEVARPWTWEG